MEKQILSIQKFEVFSINSINEEVKYIYNIPNIDYKIIL